MLTAGAYRADTEHMVLRPNRKGTYISLAFGVVCAAIGAAMILGGNLVGSGVCVLGAVGLYGGLGGLVPGQGLYLDAEGFRLRSFGKSWGADWLEIERFTPERVRIGRREDVDVVEIHYLEGVGDRHLPRHRLGETIGIDERYLVAAYGGLSNVELAETLERYRSGSTA
jgi:hypothetical protein